MAKTTKKLSALDHLSLTMLAVLQDEFKHAGRKYSDLQSGYVGIKLEVLRTAVAEETSDVDFQISVRALEEHGLARVGGELMDSRDIPGFVFLSLATKREYIFLTEDGYRKETAPPIRHRPSNASVIIHGGTFHQPQIAAGHLVNQQQNVDINNEADAVKCLSDLLVNSGAIVDQSTAKAITQMVQDAHSGKPPEKFLFQKVFGVCGSVVKEAASGLLMEVVKQSLL